MIVEVKVPQLSESVAEATLLEWHKKQGEAVSRDEILIEIETDKVVMELPSPADGVLVEIVKGDRGAVSSGELIARIDTEAKSAAGAKPAAPAQPETPPQQGKPIQLGSKDDFQLQQALAHLKGEPVLSEPQKTVAQKSAK